MCIRDRELKELLRKANNDFFNIEANAFDMKNRIAELEAALKPFADKATACEQRYSDFIPEDDRTFAFTLGDLRQARKVLGEEE